ncbi:MAG: hexokinase [Spirochaetaceae bacterium]|jgi:hexokinase|nr:hexokinase [Spirochaetaceae bacterium]
MSSFDPKALSEFARYYGFHYDISDPAVLVRDILADMDRGLKGQKSVLPMIPSYISPAAAMPPGKRVIALDAGGTNLRASLVHFAEDGATVTEGTNKVPMPGTQGRVSAEQFFNQIADLTAPLFEGAKKIEGVGFCFSYPMEITKESDGIPLQFSKEVDAREVIGKKIGEGLKDALARRGIKAPERMVLLNDTVSTLLSGLVLIPADGGTRAGEDRYGVEAGPVIGLILGTGFNTAYPEKSIPKIGFESETNPQIVVCETGNFNPRYLGPLDREYDSTTKNPGTYTQEKASSGAYLGPLTLHVLKQAINEGLLKFRRSAELLSWPTLQTKDLNSFMHAPLAMEGPLGELFGNDERDAIASLSYLASIITKRGALFSAAVVAAMVERIGAGYDPLVPVRIAVEGTTYVVYRGMRETLEANLHIMLNRKGPRAYVISPVEQASLLGAAVAALSA